MPSHEATPNSADAGNASRRRGALARAQKSLEDVRHRATSRALTGTMIGGIPGFVLPIAVIARMHVGRLTDAYAFELGVALFASSLVATALQMNVVPIMQRTKVQGRKTFRTRLSRITLQGAGFAALLYCGFAGVSIIYIDQQTHWSALQHQLVTATAIVLALYVVAVAANSVLSAALTRSITSFYPLRHRRCGRSFPSQSSRSWDEMHLG